MRSRKMSLDVAIWSYAYFSASVVHPTQECDQSAPAQQPTQPVFTVDTNKDKIQTEHLY